MAEENVMAEVMNLLEAEPAAALAAPGPNAKNQSASISHTNK